MGDDSQEFGTQQPAPGGPMMKRAIWKYALPISDIVTPRLPTGAKVLCVAMQGDSPEPQLWAIVDPDEKTLETRRFRWFGTGQTILPEDFGCEYVATVQLHAGGLVFHLFEEPTP